MASNLLKNGGFESRWDEERSHRCHVFPIGEGEYFAEFGNIFTIWAFLNIWFITISSHLFLYHWFVNFHWSNISTCK